MSCKAKTSTFLIAQCKGFFLAKSSTGRQLQSSFYRNWSTLKGLFRLSRGNIRYPVLIKNGTYVSILHRSHF